MSIIEQVMRKSREDLRAAAAQPSPPRDPAGNVGLALEVSAPPDSLAWEGSPTVAVAGEALLGTGLIPPSDQRHLQAGQYRNLRRMLVEQRTKQLGSTQRSALVAITSALAGDGKTYTAFNLASSFAREPDQLTVLIDGDLPKHQLTNHLGLESSPGLSDCLVEDRDLDSAFLLTDTPRLMVLPAGTRCVEGSELLGGSIFLALFARLQDRYPELNVVIDAGPLLLSAEAEMLCRNVEQVLLVVRHGVSTRKAVTEAVSRVGDKTHCSLLLNAWEPSLLEEQPHYGDYYGTLG
jgi:Mrp family chromosome partitioning ATPase